MISIKGGELRAFQTKFQPFSAYSNLAFPRFCLKEKPYLVLMLGLRAQAPSEYEIAELTEAVALSAPKCKESAKIGLS